MNTVARLIVALSCVLSFNLAAEAQKPVKQDTIYLPRGVPKSKTSRFATVEREDSVHFRVNMYIANDKLFYSSSVKPTFVDGVATGDILEAVKDGHYYILRPLAGTIYKEGMYVDGIRTGEWRFYDQNQRIETKLIYSDSARLQKVINFDINGVKKSEGIRKLKVFPDEYILNGLWKIYYPNSEDIASVRFFNNGVLDGPFGRYDRTTHKKIEKGQYKNGKKVGSWETFDPVSEQLRSTVDYEDGRAEGIFLKYNRLGGVAMRGEFRKGLREGLWKQYYEDSTKLEGVLEYHHDIAKATWYDSATGAIRTTGGLKGLRWHGKFTKYYIGTQKVKSEFSYKDGLLEGKETDYDEEGKLIAQTNWLHGKKHGPYKVNYDFSDNKWLELDFVNDTLHGDLKVLYRNGQLKRYSQYKKGNVVAEKCFAESGEAIECPPIRTDAIFNGDVMTYIGNNLEYPEDAKESRAEGKVLITFTVNEQGEVTEPRVEKGFYESCDNEAIRIISEMRQWIPAQIDGHTFSQRKVLPVVFWLNDVPQVGVD